MSKISAVIIDDEFFNRKLIAMLIEKLSTSFSIDGEAENIREGFKIINTIKPDVVFLDIKMPDGSGFDLLKQFANIDFEVVFITGFDQYALLAFDFNALDYVLKPIDSDKFKITLEKLQSRLEAKNREAIDLKKILQTYDVADAIITKIPIHFSSKVILLDIADIIYMRSADGGALIVSSQNEKYTSRKQLIDFEFILENYPNFVRINKDTYININYISSYSKGFEHYITMKDMSTFEVSAKIRTEILKLLETKMK